MDYTQDRKSNILFGLHDSRIKKIRFQNGVLTLEPHKFFQYTEEGKKYIPENLCFLIQI